MRLFRRARETKSPLIRREAVSAACDTNATTDESTAADRTSATSPVAPVASAATPLPNLALPSSPDSYEGLEESDVFLCEREEAEPASLPFTSREVTLFVHAWDQVEPGLLSWTFPSLRAALDAVQRMRNAIGWCVVSGTTWVDLDAARAGGAVLVEQLS